jgi:Kef-type K+ transport system membrane component KefB
VIDCSASGRYVPRRGIVEALMQPTLIVGTIVLAGFFLGEVASRVKLPKVTGYILAGVALNPGLFHIIPMTFTQHTDLITSISLSFITFSVGGTLCYPRLRQLGKGILYVTVCEAQFAFVIVSVGLVALSPLLIKTGFPGTLAAAIGVSLLLGSMGSPTDPSATLAVTHEYKAKGEVSSTILGVAAFDDALGIINYTLAVAAAGALVHAGPLRLTASLLTSLVHIFGAVALGLVFGFVFNRITTWVQKETEGVLIVLIIGTLSLCFGIARVLHVEELLATMTMGMIVTNYNPIGEKMFRVLERYTEQLIFVLFFTISGMQLDFSVLAGSYALVFIFVGLRAAGKYSGTRLGAHLAGSPAVVKRYAAGGLIPQGGIVIGLALMIKQNPAFAPFSDLVISTIIGATIVHEIVGPILAEESLKRAGEITC